MQNFSLIKSIASALGGEVSGSQVLAPGPGHSRKDRSLAVVLSATSPAGFVVHSYAGDDWRDCLDYTCGKLGIKLDPRYYTCKRPARQIATEPRRGQDGLDAKCRKKFAGQIWREAVDPRDTLVERYLNSRKLDLPDEIAGSVIRYHDRCPFGEGERHPCMVSLMRSILTDEPIAIHRTALTPDGAKIDRKMLGAAAGAAIKLDADEDITMGLAIGEGLETTLTARQKGLRPCWALGSVGAIERFPLLNGLEGLSILGEAGAASAKAVKARSGPRPGATSSLSNRPRATAT